MKIIRSPDERFENLPDFDFEPHYTTIKDAEGHEIRIHHVEAGPADGSPILLMHGNPTWAYLYRHMIGPLAEAGHRVIAVDLVGCGRSDKPTRQADYSLARHYDWMGRWVKAMDLQAVTLFCQDWGGVIGQYVVSEMPERFARVVASNTGLPIGKGATTFFRLWRGTMRFAPRFPWFMMQYGTERRLTKDEIAAYRAPFPNGRYEAALLKFPSLIAVEPNVPGVELNQAAWEKMKTFDKPFLLLFGRQDPVARQWFKIARDNIPGAKGQDHDFLNPAGHFIQEDQPEELARRILTFINKTG